MAQKYGRPLPAQQQEPPRYVRRELVREPAKEAEDTIEALSSLFNEK
jgi:hypothetical protein